MAKRIYFDSLLKKMIALGGSGATALGLFIFTYLAMNGSIEITGYSEDTMCAGTIDNPCYAYINFTANEDVFIYPLWHTGLRSENNAVTFNPDVKEWKLQRTWGDSWRTINLNKTWSTKVKYVVKFSEGKSYQVRIVALKDAPSDYIKWSFNDLDPAFLSVQKDDIVKDSKIVWGSPLRACVYRNYTNPTDALYEPKLKPVFDVKKGNVMDKGVEIKVHYMVKEDVITQNCKSEYDKINDSYYDVCKDKIETKEVMTYKWVSNGKLKFEPKQSYELRQCVERENVLDNFEVEVHLPFLGYDLSEFTLITSSGYNQSIIDVTPNNKIWLDVNETSSAATEYTGLHSFTPTGITIVNTDEIDFDGSTSYFDWGDHDDFSFTNGAGTDTAMTECFWIDLTDNAGPLSGKYDYSNKEHTFYQAGNKIYAFMWQSGSIYIGSSLNSAISTGVKHHVCRVYDGSESNTGITVYVDGAAPAQTKLGGGTYTGMINGPNHFFTGFYGAGALSNLDAQMNSYSLWKSTALTLTQITALYALGETYNPYSSYVYFYNNTDDFNKVIITPETCTLSDINISRNSTSFVSVSGLDGHEFGDSSNGFYLQISSACDSVWLNVTNVTAPIVPNYTISFCSPFTTLSKINWEINPNDFDWDINAFEFNSSGAYPTNISDCLYNITHIYATNKSLNVTLNQSFNPTYTPSDIIIACYGTNLTVGETEIISSWDGTSTYINCTLQYINVSFNESKYIFNLSWVIS